MTANLPAMAFLNAIDESFLANTSFAVLLVAMLVHWGLAAIDAPDRSVSAGGRRVLMGCAGALTGLVLLIRWAHSGHFPLSNLYESFMFLSLCVIVLQLDLEKRVDSPAVGDVLCFIPLCLNAVASLRLPPEMQEAAPLVPALRSNWLMMHVTVMIGSYAMLICGSVLAIVYLIVTRFEAVDLANEAAPAMGEGTFRFARQLDTLIFRPISLGFPLLTLGIISGAVWANEAWGSYWSWDPKETWALITWLVFAMYMHARISYRLQGRTPAVLAALGFVVVWICYLGVNLMGQGLHSYGWLQ